MPDETTYSGILGDLQRLHVTLVANASEIPHLEASTARFGETVGQAQGLARRQAALTAEKQEVSQQLKRALGDGQRLATMLRQGVKQHFGIRSEKMAEFGMQPFRGRQRKAKPAPEQPEKPIPTPAELPASPAE